MWTLTAEDVGDTAWQRLRRDAWITPLGPTLALPADVPDSPALRRAALAPHVARGRFVSGAAALWVHAGGVAPRVIHQCTRSDRHDRQAWSVWPSRHHVSTRPGDPGGFDGGNNPAVPGTPVPVAHAERALVDALRWEDLTVAVLWAARVRPLVSAQGVAREFAFVSDHDRSRARAWSAWTMLKASSLFSNDA